MLVALLLISIAVEMLLFGVPFLWRARRYAVVVPLILTASSTSGLVLMVWNPLVGVLAAISLFRVLNHMRIAKGRMHAEYLKRATLRTSVVLALLQTLTLIGMFAVTFRWSQLILALAVGQVLFGFMALVSLVYNLAKTAYRSSEVYFSDKELPSVTIAIPARNETRDMEACLRSVLASNYPKLEILVLDDCSQDKTAEVIRSFAHDGVRFVQGYEPTERWLAKNQAYDKLADEASGEFVLFCGVDVRFGPDAIRALISTVLTRKKDMISVMPRRLASEPLAAFIQPLRYWWELMPPRKFFNRPPVLSTCWIIRRKTLKKLGGLEAVQRSIIPEGYFAREIIKTDGYSFVRAGNDLDIQTQKKLPEQRETAIRMRYPQVRRRPEWVALISAAEIIFLIGPFVFAASALWAGFGIVQCLAAIASILLITSHVLVVHVSSPGNILISVVNFPLVVLTELWVGYASMFKYEFSTVEWKGRNICIPVMHVYPKLPSIK